MSSCNDPEHGCAPAPCAECDKCELARLRAKVERLTARGIEGMRHEIETLREERNSARAKVAELEGERDRWEDEVCRLRIAAHDERDDKWAERLALAAQRCQRKGGGEDG